MRKRPTRELGTALHRGLRGRCPKCGGGRLFASFLVLRDSCGLCGFDIRRYAPAAGPAFLAMAIASVFLIPVLGLAAALFGPNPVALLVVGLAILPLLAVLLLRATKGAMVGYLWSFEVEGDPGGRA